MRALTVENAGPRTTVEDLGRRMVARFGVPAGGAFDALSLAAANRLVGNSDDAAGLEATLGGPTLHNSGDEMLDVALVGADCGASLVRDGAATPVALGRGSSLAPGDTLRLGFARDGARVWIAIAGGIDVPFVLGSRSTCLSAGFGGFSGRPLRGGDVLAIAPARAPRSPMTWEEPAPRPRGAEPLRLRVVRGPQAARDDGAMSPLCATTWRVQNDSDRTGVRLAPSSGSDVAGLGGVAGIAPEGTTLGAIQVPPDGRPIVLGPDRPVTGGYAKPALLIAADVGQLALLRPGDLVRFAEVSVDAACELARQRRALLAKLRV